MQSMEIKLTEPEVRVLGSLIEKDITTPEYYPLSLNALVNACNQKTNRDPVMQLDEDAVRNALDGLQEQRLAGPARGADSRVTKYEQRLAGREAEVGDLRREVGGMKDRLEVFRKQFEEKPRRQVASINSPHSPVLPSPPRG